MSTQGPSALPPTIVQNTKPISQSAAHVFLAAYLDRTANDPALQPNASISEHGPISRTTAAAPNLTLHNLKRVQAGLGGEILGRDLTVAKQNPGEEYLDVAAGAVSGPRQEESQEDLEMKQAEDEGEAEAFAVQEGSREAVDKEERKRKKKERREAEKKAKAKKGNESH